MSVRTPLAIALLLALLVCAIGCGGSTPPAAATTLRGDVLERAEGYTSRPDWADPQGIWRRAGEKLTVTGYVAIGSEQRLDMGYRIADSYARAELLRFVASRVVAVLEDKQAWAGNQLLRERIEDTAEAVVDDWVVAGRYWEKRKDGDEVRVHVFSRLEIDQASVADLLQKATQGATDLRVTPGELLARLDASWGRLVEVGELSAESLPVGVQAPSWALVGDGESPSEFSFVCQGIEADEAKAKALAQARCNEKLCRLFGVQITARTRVTETLEGVEAESEVTEQCADVRAVGRVTTNRGGECGSSGCVAWLKQSYPRTAYDAEKERLAAPTIIERQVVIQEGDKHYRDPKACETALSSYGQVRGLTAADFLERRKYLRSALGSCQSIDDRDSGLFQSINTRLLAPIDYFILYDPEEWKGPESSMRLNFLRAPPGWKIKLDSQRFLTERIQSILKVIDDALLPMQLADRVELRPKVRDRSTETEQSETDAIIVELLKKPFDTKPTSPYHRIGPHVFLLDPLYGGFLSKRYRAFVLERLGDSGRSCDKPDISGEDIVRYLLLDKELDDTEWRAIATMMKRAPARNMESCLTRLMPDSTPASIRSLRTEEMASLVARNEIRVAADKDDNVGLFQRWLAQLTAEEQWRLYLRHRQQLRGTEGAKKSLTELVLRSLAGQKDTFVARNTAASPSELAQCEQLPGRVGPALKVAPELPIGILRVCPCLGLESLSPGARAALVELWQDNTDLRCNFFRDAEWPGGVAKWPYAERRWGTEDSPFVRFSHVLEGEYKKCSYASSLHGLRFTPRLHATLGGGRLRDVTVEVQVDGSLRSMTFREGEDRFVRKADVEAAKEHFAQCFVEAAKDYEVPAKMMRKPDASSRKIWIEHGDQGTSDGFGL